MDGDFEPGKTRLDEWNLHFEKSGYRWSKYYNTPCRKEFSLIHVIKDVVSDSWTNLRISPWFSLRNAVFYCVYQN
jgi:hypothetical protein